MKFAAVIVRRIKNFRSIRSSSGKSQRSYYKLPYLTLAALALGGSAFAAETTTYEYDAQGRLIKSSKAGGPANGKKKCTSYDPAGNRTNQTVTSASCSGGTGGGGGGGGGGSNNPPVAVNDFMVTFCGSGAVNVITNDSDPDGDTITVTSVTGGMGATISGGNMVVVSSAYTGTLTYTIQDPSGASASASISVFNDCGFF